MPNPLRYMRDEMGLTQGALADKLGASKRQYQFQERAEEPKTMWLFAVRYLFNEFLRDKRAGVIEDEG